MSDHLSHRRLSALLDGDVEDTAGAAHLESCPRCRREQELLRRMRMALSALDDLAPPVGGWRRLEAELSRRGLTDAEAGRPTSPPEDGEVPARASETGGWASSGGPWLRVAAAAVLFLGGMTLGVVLGPGAGEDAMAGGPGSGADAARLVAGGGSAGGQTSAEATYRRALEQLEELRAEGPTPEDAYRDPVAAAEHLARLDALVRATREALEEDPADPAVNDLLFQVVEEREALDEALRMASLEYR